MKAQVVSFHCVLKNRLGQVLSSSFNRDVINQLESGGQTDGKQRLRGLVAGIQNVRSGERRAFTVPADEAYGRYDPGLVFTIPRSSIPDGNRVIVGNEVVLPPAAKNHSAPYRVIEVQAKHLVLDGNHPLAGQDLSFEIEIVAARDASVEDFTGTPVVATGHLVH